MQVGKWSSTGVSVRKVVVGSFTFVGTSKQVGLNSWCIYCARDRTQTFCATATWESATDQNSNISDLHYFERMLRSPEGSPDSWRSLHIHPDEHIRRDIPRELKRNGEDLNVLDRLFKNVITPKGSESLLLGPRSTERSGICFFHTRNRRELRIGSRLRLGFDRRAEDVTVCLTSTAGLSAGAVEANRQGRDRLLA